MNSLEKAIDLGYLFLTFKLKKTINTCTTIFCIYWYVSVYSEECFWPQYMYPKLRPNNGYRWCQLGKLSHLGLEQLSSCIYPYTSLTLVPTLLLCCFGLCSWPILLCLFYYDSCRHNYYDSTMINFESEYSFGDILEDPNFDEPSKFLQSLCQKKML